MPKTPNAKTRFIKVYSRTPKAGKAGKTNLSMFRGMRGVYIIKETMNRTGKQRIVYVGSSHEHNKFTKDGKPQIYKTIMRHFQEWEDHPERERPGLSFKKYLKSRTYSVKIILCSTVKRAETVEKQMIQKYGKRGENHLKNIVKYKDYKPTKREIKEFQFFESLPTEKLEDIYLKMYPNAKAKDIPF